MKPIIHLEPITCTPDQGEPYEVWVIDGAHKPPWGQGSMCCTGCSKRHQYRWDGNSESRWIQFKCPVCSTVSAWFEEYYGDDEE